MDKKTAELIDKIETQLGQLMDSFSEPREKRGPFEIKTAILIAAIEGKKKWPIIYKANLNGKLFKKYVDPLEKKGFIEEDMARQLFKTTERGIEFLEAFSNLMEKYLL